MKIDVLTISKDQFKVFECGIIGKGISLNKFELTVTDIRDFSANKHKKTDDEPFGGGAGMVMTPQPIADAITSVDPNHSCHRIFMSPSGKILNQKKVETLAKKDRLLILCGNYEGVDQRVLDLFIDEEISIGDYILTGGELPAMVLINSILRYVPGVLGSTESLSEESFSNGLLEYPQYTRPQNFMGFLVPSVLISGNHKDIKEFRYSQQLAITKEKRPDLYEEYIKNKKD